MKKRLMIGVVALGAALALTACGATCEDACRNHAAVCRDAPASEGGFGGDQADADAYATLCTRLCETSLEDESSAPCTNQQEILDCSASAGSCDAVAECNKKCVER